MAYQIETCPIRAALTLKNIWQLLLYMCFLGLLTFNITGNPQSYPLFKTKAMIENVMSRGRYPLSAVNSIPDIYDFLEHTFVPAVAAQNVTLLDARCTADGRHANSLCLDDPFTNEALCCYTKQPNRGILAPGSHTKNLLVSPPVLRQQRVMATLAQDSPLRYFALEAIGSKGSRQKNKIASGETPCRPGKPRAAFRLRITQATFDTWCAYLDTSAPTSLSGPHLPSRTKRRAMAAAQFVTTTERASW